MQEVPCRSCGTNVAHYTSSVSRPLAFLFVCLAAMVAIEPVDAAPQDATLYAVPLGVVDDLRGVTAIAPWDAARWLLATEKGVVLLAENGQRTLIENPTGTPFRPVGICAASEGTFLVTDLIGGRIWQLDCSPSTEPQLRDAGIDYTFHEPGAIAYHDGFIAVAECGLQRVVLLNPAGVLQFATTPDVEVSRPTGIAFMKDGSVVVADADRHHLVQLNGKGEVTREVGSRGSFPGQFKEPCSIVAVDDLFYVADRLNHRVVRLDGRLNFLDQWGMHSVWPREARGATHYPVAAAVSNDRLRAIVAEPFERRVQLFGPVTDEERTRLAGLTLPSTEGVQSHFGPSIDAAGSRLVVFDPEGGSVIVFLHDLPEPVHVTTIGTPGTRKGGESRSDCNANMLIEGPGRIGRVGGLALRADGQRLLILDGAANTMQLWLIGSTPDPLVFDPFMSKLIRIAMPSTLSIDSTHVPHPDDVCAAPNGWIVNLDKGKNIAFLHDDLTLDRIVAGPVGLQSRATRLARASDGRVGLLEPQSKSLWVLDAQEKWSAIHLPSLQQPVDVQHSERGWCIADGARDVIAIIDERGTEVAVIGQTGMSDGRFWSPEALVVDSAGRITVVDGGNHRLQRFLSDGAWSTTYSLGRTFTRPRNLDSGDIFE